MYRTQMKRLARKYHQSKEVDELLKWLKVMIEMESCKVLMNGKSGAPHHPHACILAL